MARRALLIASNGSSGLTDPLKYARSDADALATAFAQPRSGFAVEVLPNTMSATAVRDRVFEVAEGCTEIDDLMIYFAGHGFIHNALLFLMLDGTLTERPLGTALKSDDIVTALNFSRAKNKILILDCCNAGTVARGHGFRGVGTEDRLRVSDLGIQSEQFQIMMASGWLEKARELDEIGGGFLSTKLREALTDAFLQADFDGDGALALDDLMRWLDTEAARHNETSEHKVPYPSLLGRGRGRFFLTRPAAEIWRPHEMAWPDGSTLVVLPGLNSDDEAMAIGKWPISNSQYRQFVASGWREPTGAAQGEDGNWSPGFKPWSDPSFAGGDLPVVCVSYADARAYCSWVDGLQALFPTTLPDAKTWTFAAFGREFPTLDPAVWLGEQAVVHHKASAPLGIGGKSRTNRRGVGDLIGNVWEWCDPVNSMAFDVMPGAASIMGGSFNENLQETMPMISVAALPDRENTSNFDLSFRIAVMIPIDLLPEDVANVLRGLPRIGRRYLPAAA